MRSSGERHLTLRQGIAMVVGIVVGVGIFKAPSTVAGGAANTTGLVALWVAGAIISVVGALCYAELSSAYPHRGGEYQFLTRAFGRDVGFLFAWGRLAVIQTGAIAAVAFVFGDYAARILPLGEHGAPFYAGAAVILFSLLNAAGAVQSRAIQTGLVGLTILALAWIAVACFLAPPAAPSAAAAPASGEVSPGLALVFVLLAYGGWNEAAYLSADVVSARRTLPRILMLALALIGGTYVLLNLAYVRVLGLEGMRASEAVAADAMAGAIGPASALLVSAIIAATALSTLNATIYTGARSSYAVGCDFARLRALAVWDRRASCPRNALALQGWVALAFVVLGTLTRGGFETMVELTAPVFWLFLLLTGVSLVVLRRRDPGAFVLRLPLRPLWPLLFCGSSLYMLHASLAYTGIGAAVGVLILLAGVPILLWANGGDARRRARPAG